jgi:ADP-ribosylglycohydrolase
MEKAPLDNTSLEDKFKGCIVGAAIGDALGMPTEYLPREKLKEYFNGKVRDFQKALPSTPCSHLNPGQYTDDTQQLIVLAKSLIKNNGFNLKDFAKDIGEWGYKCECQKGYDRFSGHTSRKAALALYSGQSLDESGMPSDSCGAAMRIAPIGLFYSNDPRKLKEFSRDASRITHNHKIAIDSAIFVSSVISNLINKENPINAVEKALVGIDSEFSEKIKYTLSKRYSNPEKVGEVIGVYEPAIETVPMAISCFVYSPEDYERTVINAANLVPGDTDSIACIAGAISGAYNGYGKIPSRFKEKIEDRKELEKIAEDLFNRSRK